MPNLVTVLTDCTLGLQGGPLPVISKFICPFIGIINPVTHLQGNEIGVISPFIT